MCGIVGIFSFQENVNQFVSYIRWANHRMIHRGPNSEGLWHEDQIIFGFRRLSIRDTSNGGNQPMVSSDNNHVIIFNGEIYNSDQIKNKLIALGYKFSSASDTEVLLYSLIHWGVDMTLELIDGIFAIGYYNKEQKTLFLIRDRAGVKPIYYGINRKGIVFSSQYDNVINHPYFSSNRINPGAFASYLQLGYVPAGSGIIEQTQLLPHGYYLKVSLSGDYQLKRYYSYTPLIDKAQSLSLQTLEKGFEDTIFSQLISDVPIGAFMSGGVDSPLVTAYAKKFKNNFNSYSIGIENDELDESHQANEYAKIINTNHHLKFINEKDLLVSIIDNMKAFSEPFADYSSIPTLILSNFAKKDITVALSGDGGDELFWGYPRNINTLENLPLLTTPKAKIFAMILYEKYFSKHRTISSKWLKTNGIIDYYYPRVFITGASHWVRDLTDAKPLKPFFLEHSLEYFSNSRKDDHACMESMRKIEFDFHLQRILLKVDRASMYNSLEVRVPMLSNKVLDLSIQFSYSDCIKGSQGKLLLKNMLQHKINNSTLPYLPKKGFSIPLDKWIRNELSKDIEEKIFNLPSELNQLINSSNLHALYQEHKRGTKNWGWLIWSIYSFAYWHSLHTNQWLNKQTDF